MRNLNLITAKNLYYDWVDAYRANTNAHVWVQKHNLKMGVRSPALPDGIDAQIDTLKKLIIETPIHEYSGLWWGDLKTLIMGKWGMRKKFLHKVTIETPFFNKPTQDTVLSDSEILYYRGYYWLITSCDKYPRENRQHRYVVLYKSKKPIKVHISVRGDVSRHEIGSFE